MHDKWERKVALSARALLKHKPTDRSSFLRFFTTFYLRNDLKSEHPT